MVLKFNTAFINRHSMLMKDRRRVMRHYLSSGFLLDLSAAFPIDILSLLLGGSLRVASWLRVPKLVHAFALVLSMNSAVKANRCAETGWRGPVYGCNRPDDVLLQAALVLNHAEHA